LPYIRLYSRSLPLQRKRDIAHQLLSITERAFQLSPEECGNINVQFLPPPPAGDEAPLDSSVQTADVFVDVSDRYLTPKKIAAFVEASAPMLSSAVLTGESRRFARMLGLKADPALQVAFQFNVSGTAYKDSSESSMAVVPLRKAA
jgi:hypothetical protein